MPFGAAAARRRTSRSGPVRTGNQHIRRCFLGWVGAHVTLPSLDSLSRWAILNAWTLSVIIPSDDAEDGNRDTIECREPVQVEPRFVDQEDAYVIAGFCHGIHAVRLGRECLPDSGRSREPFCHALPVPSHDRGCLAHCSQGIAKRGEPKRHLQKSRRILCSGCCAGKTAHEPAAVDRRALPANPLRWLASKFPCNRWRTVHAMPEAARK